MVILEQAQASKMIPQWKDNYINHGLISGKRT